MYWDLAIVESGNGGELQRRGNDLAVVNSIENVPYLSMFGGNVEASTESKPTQLNSQDWWGNSLLMKDQPSIQFNSLTERILQVVNITSGGRQTIEDAIKLDLKELAAIAIVEVSVFVISDDRLDVTIKIKQNDLAANIVVVNFKKSTEGDFWILDFNDDFNV